MPHTRRTTPILSSALALLALLCSPIFAQTTGELTGSITDASGAGVAGAKVTLVRDQTSVILTTTTLETGFYRFPSLLPGSYTLRVSAQGFTEVKVSDIAIEVNRISRSDVALQVGGVQQEVTVSASAQLLDTESGAKGQIITAAQLQNVPLQTRNPLALMTLTPGVTSASGGASFNRQGSDNTNASSAFVVNGGVRTLTGGFVEVLVDGISITYRRDGSILGTPAADALAEFRVQSGGMSSEFGHSAGGVVNYATRSGDNSWHGSLFEAHRSTATNARRALPALARRPANVYNQFGGTISGPVVLPKLYNGRNKTFFFGGYDGSRWVRNNPRTATIPTMRMRGGDFSQISQLVYDPASSPNPATRTAFPGNRIPSSRFNPIGQRILSQYPEPNLPGLASNYNGFFRVLTPVDNVTVRADHNFNEQHRAFFRTTWINSRSDQTWEAGPADASSRLITFPSRNYAASWTWSIRPNLLYSATGGYMIFRRTGLDPSGNREGGSFFGVNIFPAEASTIANVRSGARFDIYRAIGTGSAEYQIAENYQLNQFLMWALGRHTVRIGTDLRRYYTGGLITGGAPNGIFWFNAIQTSQGTAGSGNSAASALLGLADAVTVQQVPSLRVWNTQPAIYIQDDIRLTKTFTINLGLRWEAEGRLRELHNRAGYLSTTGVNSITGTPGVFRYAGVNGSDRAFTSGDYNNWSPRIGFAWSPTFLKNTVIRGAAGSYSMPVPSVGFFDTAPGFEATLQPVKPSAAEPAAVLQSTYTLPAARGPLGESAYLGISLAQPLDMRLKRPVSYQWNFGVQREILRNTMFEILYSGNRGLRLFASRNVNIAPSSLIEEAIRRQSATGVTGSALAYLNERIPNPLVGRVPGNLGGATLTRQQAAAPLPQYAGVSGLMGERDSVYHSLQTSLQRRLSGGLNLLVAYTWAKLIDNLPNAFTVGGGPDANSGTEQNPYKLRDARAVSALDRTHVLSATSIYELPFGRGKRFATSGLASALLGGFQMNAVLNAYTGTPLAVFQSGANGLSVGGARPDVIRDTLAASESVRRTVAANGNVVWMPASAYSLVNGRFGSAPIRDGRLRGPGFWQIDFGLQREFRIMESMRLQFRAEAFNSLNRTQLVNPDQNLNSPTFGQVRAVHDPRVFQFSLKLAF